MRTYKMTEEEIKAILEQMNFKGENKVWMITKWIKCVLDIEKKIKMCYIMDAE